MASSTASCGGEPFVLHPFHLGRRHDAAGHARADGEHRVGRLDHGGDDHPVGVPAHGEPVGERLVGQLGTIGAQQQRERHTRHDGVMRTRLPLLLAAAMVMAACSDDDDAASSTTEASTAPASTEPATTVTETTAPAAPGTSAAPATTDARRCGGATYEATIRRTTDGIPHITGDSIADVVFGQGYASGQDHACTLADQMLKVQGRRAAAFGPGDADANVDSDFAWLAIGIDEIARADYPTVARRA